MLKSICLIALLNFILPFLASAQQKAQLTGHVLELQTKNPIIEALVKVTGLNDTLVILKTSTNSEGTYQLQNIAVGQSLLMEVIYLGYQTYQAILCVTINPYIVAPI